MNRTAYKIMERTDDPTKFKTLFHANHGTRFVDCEIITHAQIREEAYDGSKATLYRSGWHALPTIEECRAYLSKFTTRLDKLCIVECELGGRIWAKTHSKADVLLSEQIILIREVD
jgi:hypothetical protein